MDCGAACRLELVRGLVAIPSLSRHEAAARPGSSSRCAPPATIARSSTTPATPSASSAIHPRRGRSSCSGTSTPSPATFPFASSRRPTATCCSAAAASTPRGRSRLLLQARRDSDQRRRESRRYPRRRGWRGRRRSGHEQGRALHRIALRWQDASRSRPRASSASRVTGIASRLATRDGCCSTSPPISRWPTPPDPMRASRRSWWISGTGSPRMPRRSTTARTRCSIS